MTGSQSCDGSGSPSPTAGFPVFHGDVPERFGLLCGELPCSFPRGPAVSARPQFCPGGSDLDGLLGSRQLIATGVRAGGGHRAVISLLSAISILHLMSFLDVTGLNKFRI